MNLDKEKIKRYSGILSGFTLLCVSLAALFIQSRQGNLILSILFGGLSWLGYTLTHYADTGKLLDTKDQIEKHIQEKEETKRSQKIKSSTGILLFVSGTAILAKGVSAESYYISFLGTSGAIGGYAVFHYFMEGELF